jgi:hypothetical protein
MDLIGPRAKWWPRNQRGDLSNPKEAAPADEGKDGEKKNVTNSTTQDLVNNRSQSLQDFLEKNAVNSQRLDDGTVYMATPVPVLFRIFEELDRFLGGLDERLILDFGAGPDLRVSLMANNRYGMRVTSIEKNVYLWCIAINRYRLALQKKWIKNDNVHLMPSIDAFTISWRDFDVVFFFYTEPDDEKGAREFRRKLQNKTKEMKPESILAVLFTEGQIYFEMHNFCDLTTVWPSPLKVGFEFPYLYLQFYKISDSNSGDSNSGDTIPNSSGGAGSSTPAPGQIGVAGTSPTAPGQVHPQYCGLPFERKAVEAAARKGNLYSQRVLEWEEAGRVSPVVPMSKQVHFFAAPAAPDLIGRVGEPPTAAGPGASLLSSGITKVFYNGKKLDTKNWNVIVCDVETQIGSFRGIFNVVIRRSDLYVGNKTRKGDFAHWHSKIKYPSLTNRKAFLAVLLKSESTGYTISLLPARERYKVFSSNKKRIFLMRSIRLARCLINIGFAASIEFSQYGFVEYVKEFIDTGEKELKTLGDWASLPLPKEDEKVWRYWEAKTLFNWRNLFRFRTWFNRSHIQKEELIGGAGSSAQGEATPCPHYRSFPLKFRAFSEGTDSWMEPFDPMDLIGPRAKWWPRNQRGDLSNPKEAAPARTVPAFNMFSHPLFRNRIMVLRNNVPGKKKRQILVPVWALSDIYSSPAKRKAVLVSLGRWLSDFPNKIVHGSSDIQQIIDILKSEDPVYPLKDFGEVYFAVTAWPGGYRQGVEVEGLVMVDRRPDNAARIHCIEVKPPNRTSSPALKGVGTGLIHLAFNRALEQGSDLIYRVHAFPQRFRYNQRYSIKELAVFQSERNIENLFILIFSRGDRGARYILSRLGLSSNMINHVLNLAASTGIPVSLDRHAWATFYLETILAKEAAISWKNEGTPQAENPGGAGKPGAPGEVEK